MFAALRPESTARALRSANEECALDGGDSHGHEVVSKLGVGRLLDAGFFEGISRGIEVSCDGIRGWND